MEFHKQSLEAQTVGNYFLSVPAYALVFSFAVSELCINNFLNFNRRLKDI